MQEIGSARDLTSCSSVRATSHKNISSGSLKLLLQIGGNAMIDRVGSVSVFVHDQDRAKDFYTNVLGFELRTDAPLYPGATNRWVAVAPKGAATEVVLYLPDENWEHYRQVVGQSQALTFNVADMQALHAD